MRCSFIGATNTHLNENFSDMTGMRRFYEIPTLDKSDWDAINGIDYLALWRGIDENRERGYQTDEVIAQLEKAQEHYTDSDALDEFIVEMAIRPVYGEATKTVSRNEMFAAYDIWMRSNGFKPTTSQWMTKRLMNKRIESMTDAGIRFFKVNAKSPVGGKVKLEAAV
jgi:hypothetical protein